MSRNPYPGRSRTLIVTLLATLTVGCGATGIPATHPTPPELGSVTTTMAAPFQIQAKGSHVDLNLTPEQEGALKAIGKRPLVKATVDMIGDRLAQIRKMLAADTLDVATLKKQLQADRESFRTHLADIAATLSEVRAIFTPEQRTIIAAYKPPAAKGGRALMGSAIAKKLHLTPEQVTAFEALEPTAADATLFPAIQAFMVSGDQNALIAALQASLDKLPSPEAITTALASLTSEQRQALIRAVGRKDSQ